MLRARSLARALLVVQGKPFEGTLCRAVHAATLYGFQQGGRYRPRPLYSLGPPGTGARFTPRGGAPALYLAEDQTTALHEYRQIGVAVGLKPVANDGAFVLFSMEVKLTAVLDLTSLGVRRALGTNATELSRPWRHRKAGGRAPTHALGAAVVNTGRFDAIRFQSTKGPGACLVIFTGLLHPPAFARIRDASNRLVEELP